MQFFDGVGPTTSKETPPRAWGKQRRKTICNVFKIEFVELRLSGVLLMGRPKKADKKTAINVKLPPYLIEWMSRQPENGAVWVVSDTEFY